MADFYYSDQAATNNKKSDSLLLRVVDLVMLLLSVPAFLALLITLISSHISPAAGWIFSITGLVTPAIYLFAFFMALYWIIRWRWRYATILIIPLAIGAPGVSRYYNIETSKSYGEPSRRGTVRLMTYNVKNFSDREGQKSTPEMNKFLDSSDLDIVCFQEFRGSLMPPESQPELFSNFYSAKIDGMAIFSRFKILDSSKDLINEEFDSGSAFWTDLLVAKDTIRLFNIHLHTTTITSNDDTYLRKMEFLADSLSEDKFRSMVKRFKTTSIGRATQADTLATHIAASPYRVIVCGDFNDTPNSYAYRKISKGLQDAFQEVGIGYSHTFDGFLNLLRIDYILAKEPTQVLSYEVLDSVQLSDHLPVVTTLKL